MSECFSECLSVSGWLTENEWVSEWASEQVSEWVVLVSGGWVGEWVSERASEWVSGTSEWGMSWWVIEWKWVSEHEGGWVNECVSQSVEVSQWEWVGEWVSGWCVSKCHPSHLIFLSKLHKPYISTHLTLTYILDLLWIIKYTKDSLLRKIAVERNSVKLISLGRMAFMPCCMM